MYKPPTPDHRIPVKRLRLDLTTGTLVAAPKQELFLRGPIPLEWVSRAAILPGKTLNVAIALWLLHGMAKGKPFKLTRKALKCLNVGRDAASTALGRLEQAELVRVERRSGQSPMISLVTSITESGAKSGHLGLAANCTTPVAREGGIGFSEFIKIGGGT